MHTTDPGYPQSHIDTLLLNPGKQEAIRGFFAAFDAHIDRFREWGYLVNTADNEPVKSYPAMITESGLLFELYSTEHRAPGPDPKVDIMRATQDDVLNAVARDLSIGTNIRGGLLDLNQDKPESVHLNAFTGQYSRFDAAVQPRLMYKEGRGTLLMFGHREDASIFQAEQAIQTLALAIRGITDKDEQRAVQAQVMQDLAAEGAYLLTVNFHQYRDAEGKPTGRLALPGNIKSEQFSKARRRAGFEL